jgi:hypothetical protein
MRSQHPLLERGSIKGPWFAAGFTFNQGGMDGDSLITAFLFAPDQLTYTVTVVCVVPSLNLRINPTGLLVS